VSSVHGIGVARVARTHNTKINEIKKRRAPAERRDKL
jgi:hypothetical protein